MKGVPSLYVVKAANNGPEKLRSIPNVTDVNIGLSPMWNHGHTSVEQRKSARSVSNSTEFVSHNNPKTF